MLAAAVVLAAAAEGIIVSKYQTGLSEYGGQVKLTKSPWKASLMQRKKLIKHRRYTQIKTVVTEVQRNESQVSCWSEDVAHQHKVTSTQSGLNVVSASTMTIEEEGKTRILIVGHGDKQQIIPTLAISKKRFDVANASPLCWQNRKISSILFLPFRFDMQHIPNHWTRPTPESQPSLFHANGVQKEGNWQWNTQE